MRRAIGIVRQSRGREESLSPAEQRERIASLCERESLELIEVHEEIDVSGGTPLVDRVGLRAAVEAIEAGAAEVVVVAYFDRLFRSISVQAEVGERIEAAGGNILAADVGEVSSATAGQWISGGVLGLVAEYQRRSARERAGAAQAMAVAEGRAPFGSIPPGYERIGGGVLFPNADAPAVRRAFEMRVEGAPITEVRAYLREQGIERSYHGVQHMLQSRIYLGEIHFGKLENLAAHEPIVDRALFDAVQRIRVKRGTRPKSDRLLARQGVLRCGTCGGRLVLGVKTENGNHYPFYRCSTINDCPRRVTIGADLIERHVVSIVKRELAGMEGRASVEQDARSAEDAALAAQEQLDAAIRAFGGLESEPAAIERLRELRDARDAARDRVDHLSHLHAAMTVTVDDWDRLSLEERRGLVRATIETVSVAKGTGLDRVTVELLGQ